MRLLTIFLLTVAGGAASVGLFIEAPTGSGRWPVKSIAVEVCAVVTLAIMAGYFSPRPRRPAPSTTRAELLAEYERDLLDLDMDLDEFAERWRGRPVPSRKRGADRANKPSYAEGRFMELFAELMTNDDYREEPSAKGPAGVEGAPGLQPGQWVRVRKDCEWFPGTLGQLVSYEIREHVGVWQFQCHSDLDTGTFLLTLADEFLEAALPLDGEMWEQSICAKHPLEPPGTQACPRTRDEKCEMERVRCGCLTPVNFGWGERS